MDIYTQNFTVTLTDVGENNTITNKGFLRILQEIASIHSNTVGFGLNTAQKTGYFWMVLNWKLEVFSRPCWNSSLKVSTWCPDISHIYFYRDFEIFDDSGKLVAIASSKWILFDFVKHSVVRIDKNLQVKYLKPVNRHVFEAKESKLLEPKNLEFMYKYVVARRDLDSNHHVNNLNYIDYAYEVLPEDVDFNHLEVTYKHEAKLGDILNIFYVKVDDVHYVVIKNQIDDTLHCIIKLY